jgi:hypothetical protein
VPHDTLSFLVRAVHTAGMALMLGGAALVWAAAAWGRPHAADGPGRLLGLAAAYERLFWLALGVQVMTGIGNLGALGLNLPGPETPWGGRLVLKLLAVLVFALFSLVRTVVIARLGSAVSVPATSSLPAGPKVHAAGPHPPSPSPAQTHHRGRGGFEPRSLAEDESPEGARGSAAARAPRLLPALYGLTTAALAGILLLAVALAHG